MNPSTPLPDPARLRRLPKRFSWLDHRLLRDGHLQACSSPEALALYLILACAADVRGLSYYSDKRLSKILALPSSRLSQARRSLIDNGLIAWHQPHYQVLCLDPETIREAHLRDPAQQHNRSGQPMSLKEILQQIAQSTSAHD